MWYNLIRGVILISSVLQSCSAQTTIADSWVVPGAPDFQDTFTLGNPIEIQWTDTLWEWFGSYAPTADVTNVDLWITGFYIHQYAHLISTSVDLNATLSLVWKSQLPSEQVDNTTQWVFRFLPHNLGATEVNISNDTVSSPGFNFAIPASLTSSTSSSSATSTTSSTTTALSSATTASSAQNATTHGHSSSLSGGDEAGIAVGAIVGAALLLGIGWYFARRRTQPKTPDSTAMDDLHHGSGMHAGAITGTAEHGSLLKADSTRGHPELDSDSSMNVKPPAELDN